MLRTNNPAKYSLLTATYTWVKVTFLIALSVTVIVLGNETGEWGSNPGWNF